MTKRGGGKAPLPAKEGGGARKILRTEEKGRTCSRRGKRGGGGAHPRGKGVKVHFIGRKKEGKKRRNQSIPSWGEKEGRLCFIKEQA